MKKKKKLKGAKIEIETDGITGADITKFKVDGTDVKGELTKVVITLDATGVNTAVLTYLPERISFKGICIEKFEQ